MPAFQLLDWLPDVGLAGALAVLCATVFWFVNSSLKKSRAERIKMLQQQREEPSEQQNGVAAAADDTKQKGEAHRRSSLSRKAKDASPHGGASRASVTWHSATSSV